MGQWDFLALDICIIWKIWTRPPPFLVGRLWISFCAPRSVSMTKVAGTAHVWWLRRISTFGEFVPAWSSERRFCTCLFSCECPKVSYTIHISTGMKTNSHRFKWPQIVASPFAAPPRRLGVTISRPQGADWRRSLLIQASLVRMILCPHNLF